MSTWKDIDAQLDDAVLEAATMFTDIAMRIQARKGDSVVDDLRIRYEVGSAEHKDSWEDWHKDRFLREAREELLDLILYHAMMRVVHKD
jgi:hypothetical protein